MNQSNNIMIIIDPLANYEKCISLAKDYSSMKGTGFIVVNILSKLNQTDEELEFIRKSFELADESGASKVFNVDVSIMSTICRLAECENVSHLLFPKLLKYRLLTLVLKRHFKAVLKAEEHLLVTYKRSRRGRSI